MVRNFFFLLVLFLSLTCGQIHAGTISPGRQQLSIYLTAWNKRTIGQVKTSPLIVSIRVLNPDSSGAYLAYHQSRNSALASNSSAKDDKASKPDLPQAVLGSQANPAATLISLSLLNRNGSATPITLRKLKSVPEPSFSARLQGDDQFVLLGAIDPQQLASLPDGDYQLTATLDTRSCKDMWKGTASDAIDIHLQLQPLHFADTNDELHDCMNRARYFNLDKNSLQLHALANRMLQLNSALPCGYEILGDAFRCEGKKEEAKLQYEKALAICQSRQKTAPSAEPSVVIENKLLELQ